MDRSLIIGKGGRGGGTNHRRLKGCTLRPTIAFDE